MTPSKDQLTLVADTTGAASRSRNGPKKSSARGFAAIIEADSQVAFFSVAGTIERLARIHGDPPAMIAAVLRDLQPQLEAVWRRQDGSLHRNYQGYEPGRLLAHVIATGIVEPVDSNEGKPIDPERFGYTGTSLAAALRGCDPPIHIDEHLEPLAHREIGELEAAGAAVGIDHLKAANAKLVAENAKLVAALAEAREKASFTDNPLCPHELRIAVEAWRAAAMNAEQSGKTPAAYIREYLQQHYGDVLRDERQVDRIVAVTNWKKRPGQK